MKVIAIIPARYNSTRLPGKPLCKIQGETLIQRVYDRTCLAKSVQEVVVATDDQRIFDHVKSFGGEVIMTKKSHESGTDRCAEAARHYLGYEVVVNVQGDEPFICPDQIELLLTCYAFPEVEIASLYKAITDTEELFDQNRPKVVMKQQQKSLVKIRQASCFSRQVVPPLGHNLPEEALKMGGIYHKHIGIYAYKTAILDKLAALKPSPLEQAEKLEQLRWLENGYAIYLTQTQTESFSIDTPEDLAKANQFVLTGCANYACS